ncbi:MAG: hypothetical protein QOE37_805, partial [Microbacteriaceae bacterium]|nr:hypothetical protein [Microbacteriaceae bacterium]
MRAPLPSTSPAAALSESGCMKLFSAMRNRRVAVVGSLAVGIVAASLSLGGAA